MNFEKWYKDFYGVDFKENNTDCFFDSECAWNACKKEMSKILNQYPCLNQDDLRVIKNLQGEIEKL